MGQAVGPLPCGGSEGTAHGSDARRKRPGKGQQVLNDKQGSALSRAASGKASSFQELAFSVDTLLGAVRPSRCQLAKAPIDFDGLGFGDPGPQAFQDLRGVNTSLDADSSPHTFPQKRKVCKPLFCKRFF